MWPGRGRTKRRTEGVKDLAKQEGLRVKGEFRVLERKEILYKRKLRAVNEPDFGTLNSLEEGCVYSYVIVASLATGRKQ